MIRTFIYFAWFWASLALTLPFCLVLYVLSLVGPRRFARRALQVLARFWARSLAAAAGMRIDAEGLERIPREGPVCLVANHVGYMDIVLSLALIPRPFGFVAKKEALVMPFLNLWILALGSVFLDRGSLERGKRSIDRGIAKIAAGGALIVFPEGTRSRGGPVGPFRSGSFRLATRAGAILVPVSIRGSASVWEANRRIRPAHVSFIVHEPIPTAAMSAEERKALPERVRGIIASRA